MSIKVSYLQEFEEALLNGEKDIEITQSFLVPYTIHLGYGVSITGPEDKSILISFNNGEGFGLEGNNSISNLAIQTVPTQRAIYVKSNHEDLGTINLNNLTVTGQVQVLTRAPQKTLDLNIDTLDIISSDSRLATEKPLKYGVTVYQGALTVYNFNSDSESNIKANIQHVSLGRPSAPVIGTGIFVGGFTETGGTVDLEYLQTDAIYSNGMIPFGQPTLITGAIFIVSGAHAKQIQSDGPLTTYGVNDMVIDVWGEVDNWTCEDYIRSFGTSGIGFVNFGTVHQFNAKYPIETYGSGARGFNQYDGTIDEAVFESIQTYGDGSIGMQFSKPVGTIKINKDVKTHGATGMSLVKGEIQELDAIALSVKPGGSIKELNVGGNIETQGKKILAFSVEDEAEIHDFNITGNIVTDSETTEKVQLHSNAGLSEDIKNKILNCVK